MSRIYFAVLPEEGPLTRAVLNLDRLPPGVDANQVSYPWTQGTEIGRYIQANELAVAAYLQELNQGQPLSPEAAKFFSDVASFWENLPPSEDGEKVGVFASGGPGIGVHFIRTSPEVGDQMHVGFGELAKKAG